MSQHSPIDRQKWWKRLKKQRHIRVLLYILLAVVMYASMLPNVIPETLNVELGAQADQSIRSPITIEDQEETKHRKQQAAESIEPVYTSRQNYAQNQVNQINEIFLFVDQIQEEAAEREREIESFEEKLEDEDEDLSKDDRPEPIEREDKRESLQSMISARTNDDLSDDTLDALLHASEKELELAKETTTNAIHDVMSDEIKIGEVDDAKGRVEDKIVISTISPRLYDAMNELARFAITANHIYDEEGTERAREQAVEAIDPVVIREGQLIVEEGDLITSEVYHQLSLVGLLDDASFTYPYIGLALLVVLITGLVAYYLGQANTTLRDNNTHLLMYVLIFTVTLLTMKIVSYAHVTDLHGMTLMVPVALGSMLITILLHARIALFSSFLFALIAGVIFNAKAAAFVDYTHIFYVFFSSASSVFFMSRSNRTVRVLQAGLFVALVNMLATTSLLMLKNGQYTWVEIGSNLGFSAASGFLAAVLTLGLLPFFEAGFGILSSTKLIELSNPNHPLLRKILLEAPGTYHHSVIVANLSEAACESIGANGLLARVGAYYHDLGKTKRPHFFIENQMKIDNPHDKISPQLSRTIIISHPYDGADELRENRMPREIIDIAEQHHGTTLLKFFYHKAAKESDQNIPESEFRYPGPKAQSQEAAIVGIADCVEAAVRSMSKPTPDKIEGLIKKIINERLEDGQFDECDLTLKQLHSVSKSMMETLKGTFHSRIEYPDDENIKAMKEKVNSNDTSN
ncbi:HD family phosphohydrolase [Texcoconibacillus texcoconensis]|uniref:HD domain-containing protein n=1 Tax=Texcoconibacillus texcoconensis TaxID=1095777 RepID=A0A840QRL8_9BACI|nr:HD family phosphohydrolase [Texcoconibacillus texcoconensis]MBB5173937.1 hypothetical protein [Texcoconibacillus texcoconensis]